MENMMKDDASFVKIGDAVGLPSEMRSTKVTTNVTKVPVTKEEIGWALAAAYEAKAWLTRKATAVDLAFEEAINSLLNKGGDKAGFELRKDGKGNKLAIQSGDVPKGVDRRLKVTLSTTDSSLEFEAAVASSSQTERVLGGTLRHNKAIGLAQGAGRLITIERSRAKSIQNAEELIRIELRDNKEDMYKVLRAFQDQYKARVEKSAAAAFISAKEPSRKDQLHKGLTPEAESMLDKALRLVAAEREQKRS